MPRRTPPSPNPLPQREGEAKSKLARGLAALKLNAALAVPLLAYLRELEKWNAAYNLTAVRDPAEMITRHLLDSLVVFSAFPQSPAPSPQSRLVDVGSGAGLPGIPLAMAEPRLAVTLLDGNLKKARFLRHVKRTLKLNNVEVVQARAEAYRPEAPFDAVISRAFASLGDFLRATAHLCRPDGQWLAMKGKLDAAELRDIPRGFQVVNVEPLHVPGLPEERHLVCVSRLPSRVSRS